jgi:hypothetical protein
MEPGGTIVDLRNALTSRFPHLRFGLSPAKARESVSTGIPTLDAVLDGGLPRGGFTELVAKGYGTGSAEVIHQLLFQVAFHRQFLALVDGCTSFDVQAVPPDLLKRLLWVRCRNVTEALKAADLLLRDRNFSVLVLDLKLNAGRELRKVNATVWHRYGRLIEHNQSAVLVVTPEELVSGATYRVAVESRLGIDALAQSRAELLGCLRFKLMRVAADDARPSIRAQAS